MTGCVYMVIWRAPDHMAVSVRTNRLPLKLIDLKIALPKTGWTSGIRQGFAQQPDTLGSTSDQVLSTHVSLIDLLFAWQEVPVP